jgi:DNA-binding winged helix-turn-helix (wHTH) protein/tetratricopeptide (TPR) repeat protein
MLRMRVMHFSNFELDERSGELSRAGRRVALTHQSFVVLALLAGRAGDLVTRDELRRALWSGDTHVDFERGLNFVIASVRRALGDDARRPQFVETVTKRGYRFIAEVRMTDVHVVDDLRPAPVRAVPPAPERSGWLKRWALAAAIPVMCAQGTEIVRAHTRTTAAPEAVAAFERGDYELAVALDSRFAEAHWALGERYKRLADSRIVPQRIALAQARAATLRAITLEDAPESRSLMGSLRLALDWDVAGARDDAARALASHPDWDIGLAAYANVLSAAGDDEAALDAIGRAEALSPSCDLVAWESAVLHFRARRYDEALAALDRSSGLARSSGHGAERDWIIRTRELRLQIFVRQDRWRDAQREAVTLAALHGGDRERLEQFARMPARDAVTRFFEISADRMLASRDPLAVTPSRMALVSQLAGRTDDALTWLERAAESRDAELLFVLRDPALDLLRELPRYQAVVSETRRVDRRSN